jgi:hypothetical protein
MVRIKLTCLIKKGNYFKLAGKLGDQNYQIIYAYIVTIACNEGSAILKSTKVFHRELSH